MPPTNHADDLFSAAQLEQMRIVMREECKALLREELDHVGVNVNDTEDVISAREDFRFLRKMRRMVDSASGKVGTAVILGFIGFCAWALMTAANLWNKG